MEATPTVNGISFAAPVPVPPPIPAVMNTILVPSFSCALISSILSSAASRARSGRLPAPSPCVMLRPSCSFTGTGDSANAWLSVLQRTNVTSWIPSRYMWFTALPPPPPTPITLMIFGESVGKSNCTISSISYTDYQLLFTNCTLCLAKKLTHFVIIIFAEDIGHFFNGFLYSEFKPTGLCFFFPFSIFLFLLSDPFRFFGS